MVMEKRKQTTLFNALHTCFKLRADLPLCQSGISHLVDPVCSTLSVVLFSSPATEGVHVKVLSFCPVCVTVRHNVLDKSGVVNFSPSLYQLIWCKLTQNLPGSSKIKLNDDTMFWILENGLE